MNNFKHILLRLTALALSCTLVINFGLPTNVIAEPGAPIALPDGETPATAAAGQFGQFHILLNNYFRACAKQALPEQAVMASSFVQSVMSNMSFDSATQAAIQAAANQTAQPSTAKQKVARVYDAYTGPLAQATSALYSNMLSGTIADFNHKAVVLGGVLDFDPKSAPCVYNLWNAINENYQNDASFRKLKIDTNKWHQFFQGGKWIIVATALVAIARPQFWKSTIENVGSLARSVTNAISKLDWRVGDETVTSEVDTAADSSKITDRPKTEAEIQALEAQKELDSMNADLKQMSSLFREQGVTGADERTNAKLLQDALAGDKAAEKLYAERTGLKMLYPPKPSRSALFVREKLLSRFSAQSMRKVLIGLTKFAGIYTAGGIANIGLQKICVQIPKSINYRGPQILGCNFGERLVPLDQGGAPDLFHRGYAAMAALNYTCHVDQFSKGVASLINMLQNKRALTPQQYKLVVANRDAALAQLGSYFEQYLWLSSKTIYRYRWIAPKEVRYDKKSGEIWLRLPVGRDTLTEHFPCEEYAGIAHPNPLMISLDYSKMQLGKTYALLEASTKEVPLEPPTIAPQR